MENQTTPMLLPSGKKIKHGNMKAYGLLAVLVLGCAFLLLRKDVEAPNNEELSTSTAEKVYQTSNKITVDTQIPGEVVLVRLVVMEKSGWLAVHEIDNQGKPANILGATYLKAGEWKDEQVELLRQITDSQKYYAIIHADDGDRQFDFKKDLPAKAPNGSYIQSQFSVISAGSRGN